MQININEKEREYIINECLSLLGSAKDCDAKPDGDPTIDNYNQFKFDDFSGEYGMSKKDYKVVISLLNKLKEK